MRVALLFVVGLFATMAAPNVLPEEYPTKPMRLIVPFPPGGGTDLLARVVAQPMFKVLGEQVVVDNRPGAGGAIAAELAALAEPDGYTLVLVSSSYSATSAYRKPRYDPVNGIEPIVLIGTTGILMSVNPSVPVKTVKELIEYAKARPGKLNYASVGIGSVPHLAIELFKQKAGVNLVNIPYRGGGPAFVALIGGESHVSVLSLVPSIPHVRAGRLRAIAVTTEKRMSLLPDVPTISETVPGFVVNHWYGIWGPKGIPKPIVTRWNKEVSIVVNSSEMKRRMRLEGLETAGGPPEQLRQFIERDVEKWRDVIKKANITDNR